MVSVRRAFLCGIWVLFATLLAGCREGADPPDQPGDRRPEPVALVLVDGRPDPAVLAEEQVLYRGNGEEPQTLDPHRAEGVPSANILRDLFEGLTTESPSGEIIPGAAMRWNISRDGRTYTFYLRRDAVWSNGDALTADDFVYSLRRAADPRTAANSANNLLPILNAREVINGERPPTDLGVAALDAYSLQITLAAPTPYFLGLLAHSIAYPVHRPSVEEHGERFARPGTLVSNGAFVLRNWEVRAYVELARNERYHAAADTILEGVFYLPIEDLSSEVKLFRAGELDWTYEVPHNQFDWLREHYPHELVISPWLGSYFFGFNLSQEPFEDNPALRRALALAIDRDIITGKVTQFGEKPSFALVPPGIDDYEPAVPEYAAWTQQQRLEEAQRKYAEAGYSTERPLQVELRYNTSENHKKIALAVASMWKQALGVNTTLINEEWKVFLQNREQKIVTEVFRAGWISDYNDPYSFLELFRSGHGRNDYAYSNESYDALLEEIARERVPARRNRMMHEAERLLLADDPIIPVYTYVTKRLVDRDVAGWQNNVLDHHYSRSMFKLRSKTPEERAGAVTGAADVADENSGSDEAIEADGNEEANEAGEASTASEPGEAGETDEQAAEAGGE